MVSQLEQTASEVVEQDCVCGRHVVLSRAAYEAALATKNGSQYEQPAGAYIGESKSLYCGKDCLDRFTED